MYDGCCLRRPLKKKVARKLRANCSSSGGDSCRLAPALLPHYDAVYEFLFLISRAPKKYQYRNA